MNDVPEQAKPSDSPKLPDAPAKSPEVAAKAAAATERKPTLEETLKATGVLLGLLPQIAGLVVGFTALAYGIGWYEARAYFQDIGASWALKVLSPTQILQTGVWLIGLVAAFTLFSVFLLTQRSIGQKGLRRWGMFHAIVAASCLFVVTFFADSLSPPALFFLSGAVSVFWGLCAAATFGEVIACLAGDQLKGDEYQLYILYFAVIYGFVQAPGNMGRARAHIDADPTSSMLSVAHLEEKQAPSEWRLVSPAGDKMLLMIPATEKSERRFRLVEADAIMYIAAKEKDPPKPQPKVAPKPVSEPKPVADKKVDK